MAWPWRSLRGGNMSSETYRCLREESAPSLRFVVKRKYNRLFLATSMLILMKIRSELSSACAAGGARHIVGRLTQRLDDAASNHYNEAERLRATIEQ